VRSPWSGTPVLDYRRSARQGKKMQNKVLAKLGKQVMRGEAIGLKVMKEEE